MDVKWIKVSVNLFDDEKIRQIRSLPEGNSMCLIWLQLLLLAGKVNQDGMLVLNHTEIAYTDDMLATHFEMPMNTVLMALETFKRFGMIEIVDNIYHITNWQKYQQRDEGETEAADILKDIRETTRNRVQKHREKQKALTEGNKTDLAPVPAAKYHLILIDKTSFDVTQEMIDQWQAAYPAIDVDQEIRQMIAWCDANPKNRKTRTGAKRFIVNWLSRSQNRAPRAQQSNTVFIPNPGLEDWN